MEPDEAAALLAEFGVDQPGLDKVIASGYGALDLITFLTTGEDETRAWQVRRGARRRRRLERSTPTCSAASSAPR